MATLTISLFTPQGQLLDMRDEVNDIKEESDNESADESTITDQSMSHESLTGESVVSDIDTTEPQKRKSQKDKDVKQTLNELPGLRYEDVMHWADYKQPSEKKESHREISIEDLERGSKHRTPKDDTNINCEVCDYICKKKLTMSKHMNTKHRGMNRCPL